MMIRKRPVAMAAFPVGQDCPLSRFLMAAGLLQRQQDGMWRVITRETEGVGELVREGDYIKLDSAAMPYPVEKEWFEENHVPAQVPGMYLQKPVIRKAWSREEFLCPEMIFLLNQDRLDWHRKQGFRAWMWDTWQTAEADAVIVFDWVAVDSRGEIEDVEFHFVAQEEFRCSYEVVGGTDPSARFACSG